MKLVSFCLLTTLSLAYAGLTVAETLTYHRWEKAVNDQRYIQAQVAFFDHLNTLLDQMVRQMAIDSRHDPAMAKLLQDHNINVIVETTPAVPHDPSTFDASPPANPSTEPASSAPIAPATPPPSHP